MFGKEGLFFQPRAPELGRAMDDLRPEQNMALMLHAVLEDRPLSIVVGEVVEGYV
jgi:type IV secretory pathway ATPase VirB11/archaellum biosynthesis ATPase